MKIVGQKDTAGKPMAFTEPVEVVQFGDTLRDSLGMCWAVLDEYGSWVSPTMRSVGVRSEMVIEE